MRYQNNDHLIYRLIGCMTHSHIFDHMTCHMISALHVLGSPLVNFATQEIKHAISQIPCFNIYDNKGFVNKLSSVNHSFYIILGYLLNISTGFESPPFRQSGCNVKLLPLRMPAKQGGSWHYFYNGLWYDPARGSEPATYCMRGAHANH